jgi:arylsulfatase A-like enzyme
MKNTILRSTIILCSLIPLVSASRAEETPRPNVLLIAVDDLNDWVSCLEGHPDTRTPNIDRLAARGVLFRNAHCQAPICNPSRTSIIFGMRPSTTGMYDNGPNSARTPEFHSKHVSMPRHFAANGYRTFTTGKIYHQSSVPDDDFHVVGPRPGQWNGRGPNDPRGNDLDQVVQSDKPGHMHPLWDFGPQSYDEKKFADYVDTSWAIEKLEEKHEQPFFLAIGLYRPHVPFFSPKRVYDSPDLVDGVNLPTVKADDWADIPSAAKKLSSIKHLPTQDWMEENGNAKWTEAVHSYLASIRWTDEQVGRLLDALDRSPHSKDTIVVLFSDHGFHLGEKRHWAKWTLWERSTRVPFIISAPGLKAGRSTRPVELLSIYPTLIDLAKLSPNDELEGVSLRPLLENPEASWDHAAITTYKKNNHAVRTERWRYIRYADGTEELYDHQSDPNEWNNLAADPRYASVIADLKTHLPRTNVKQFPR